MTTAGRSPGRAVPDKATLFCPDCSYQSRFDGEWREIETVSTIRVRCPECGAEIACRPCRDSTDIWNPAPLYESVWETWETSVRLWQDVWKRSLSFP